MDVVPPKGRVVLARGAAVVCECGGSWADGDGGHYGRGKSHSGTEVAGEDEDSVWLVEVVQSGSCRICIYTCTQENKSGYNSLRGRLMKLARAVGRST